ncbi:MAG: hypothetical protein AB8F78_14685 [Saprospiraceae bacterium]
MKSHTDWVGLDEVQEFEFSIGYQIGESPEVKRGLTVSAHSSNPSDVKSGCPHSEDLLKELKKYITKKKITKATPLWNELIRRGYRGEEFKQLKEMLGELFPSKDEKPSPESHAS